MKEQLKNIVPCVRIALAILALVGCAILVLRYFSNQSCRVEQYCARVNARNVEEYKNCVGLRPVEILDNLASEAKDMYDVPNLPEMKEIR